jgi:hypothetical protein
MAAKEFKKFFLVSSRFVYAAHGLGGEEPKDVLEKKSWNRPGPDR